MDSEARYTDAPRKVLFLEPRSPDCHIFSIYPLPRLGPVILATMLREAGMEAEVLVEELAEVSSDALREASVVGITTTTSTAPRAYAWADESRRLGKTVVMGGPHVTFRPREALEHADYLVLGEAESIAVALFRRLLAGDSVKDLAGVVGRDSSDLDMESRAPVIQDLDTLPVPDHGLVRGMAVKSGPRKKKVIPVQASRGCPYSCTFCSVSRMFGKIFRYRSVDHLMGELRRYDSKHNHIFFYDDNLAADRRWFRRFLKRLVAEKTRFQWSAQVRIDVSRDPELLDLMSRTRCEPLFVGVESLNPRTLQSMNKKQPAQDIESAMERFREHGLGVHGMFVLGLDSDTPESIRQTVDFAIRAGFRSAQFLILAPLPGTPVWDELSSKGRIRFGDFSLYDGHHVTFQPARMSMEELQELQLEAHDRFYGIQRILARLLTGRIEDLAIFWYARRLNGRWKRRNRVYRDLLHLMNESDGMIQSVRFVHPSARLTAWPIPFGTSLQL